MHKGRENPLYYRHIKVNIKKLISKAYSVFDYLSINLLVMFIFIAGYIGLLRVIGESSDITKFITCYIVVTLLLFCVFRLLKQGKINRLQIINALIFIILFNLLLKAIHYLQKVM